MQCRQVSADGVYIGKDAEVNCVYQDATCQVDGCFWRRWHQLKEDEYKCPDSLFRDLTRKLRTGS